MFRVLTGCRPGWMREDLAEGCPEQLDREFVRWTWGYNKRVRERVLTILENLPDKAVYIVRNKKEADKLLYLLTKGNGH